MYLRVTGNLGLVSALICKENGGRLFPPNSIKVIYLLAQELTLYLGGYNLESSHPLTTLLIPPTPIYGYPELERRKFVGEGGESAMDRKLGGTGTANPQGPSRSPVPLSLG